MCQLFACVNGRPSYMELADATDINRDGAGIAWVEGDVVRWEKGLPSEPDLIRQKIKELPFPYLIHFRYGTAGGDIPENTHPFPVTRSFATPPLEGTARSVLAHNGHFGNYNEILDILKPNTKNKVVAVTNDKGMFTHYMTEPHPARKFWTDTRVLAWLAAFDKTAKEKLFESPTFKYQKIAVLTPMGFQIFNKNSWDGHPGDANSGYWRSAPHWRGWEYELHGDSSTYHWKSDGQWRQYNAGPGKAWTNETKKSERDTEDLMVVDSFRDGEWHKDVVPAREISCKGDYVKNAELSKVDRVIQPLQKSLPVQKRERESNRSKKRRVRRERKKAEETKRNFRGRLRSIARQFTS